MLPKYANARLLASSATQIVSRADLDSEEELSRPVPVDERTRTQDVQQLEQLLKSTLGDFHFDSEVRRDEPSRKKRKSKEVKEDKIGEETVTFRLFSSKPPKLVSLKPKRPPPVKVLEPAYEDDEAEASLRAQRASEVAVDADWLLKKHNTYIHPVANHDRKLSQVVTLIKQADPPSLMLAERVKAAHVQRSFAVRLPPRERPCPHEVPSEKLLCPVIEVENVGDVNPSRSAKKRRRRGSTATAASRPPPSFWRPLQEMGGKSAGYAMGYEGSRPVPTGSSRQWKYRRDRMRSGVLRKW